MLSRPSTSSSALLSAAAVSGKPFVCTRCLHLRRASSAAAAALRNNNPSAATTTTTRPQQLSSLSSSAFSAASAARTSHGRIAIAAALRTFATTAIPPRSSSPALYSSNGITPLPHRRLLALAGPDAAKFLQGLTTNNVLQPQQTEQQQQQQTAGGWYTAFLNAQGRVLYDAFVYPTLLAAAAASGAGAAAGAEGGDWACFIEADGECVDGLFRLLKRHKLRSKVKLRVVDEGEWAVWAAWTSASSSSSSAPQPELDGDSSNNNNNNNKGGAVVHLLDTRAPGFGGHRLLVPGGAVDELLPASFSALPRAAPRDYRIRRYLHGVAEGPAEMLPEEALPLESNVDLMHGVDFRKGCYVGQELTIRTKHTGVVRKRILPVQLYDLVEGEGEPDELAFAESTGGGVKAEDVPVGVAGVRKMSDGVAAEEGGRQQDPSPPPARTRRKDNRSAGKWLAGVGNVGLALCRLEMMTDVKVAVEGMAGPAGTGGEYRPGVQFGLKWTVMGQQEERAVGVKAFVPEWHQLRVEEEARSKKMKKRVVQKDAEEDEE